MTEDMNPLGPLADAAVPEIDSVTRDRIEAGLRVQHGARQAAPAGRVIPRRFVIGPVIALVLLVATIALVARDETAVAALELRDAENVTVTLADGAVVTDPADGFALTDGAIVVVGPDGRVTIDDVTLAGGTTVTVRDGRLVTDVVATTTIDRPDHLEDVPPPRDEPPDDVRTTTTTTSTPPDVRPPADGPVTEPTVAPPTVAPTTTEPLGPPTDSRRPPVDSTPVDDSRHGDDPGTDVAVALRVTRGDGGVRVAWNTEGVAGTDWRVVVVRTIDGSDPAGIGDGTIIGEGVRGELNDRWRDLPEGVEMLRYRVVILDASDGVVARSAAQSLTPFGS